MFKKTSGKRKTPSGTRRRIDYDDGANDDEEDPQTGSALIQAANRKKQKRGIVRDLVRDDQATEISRNSKKRATKKSSRNTMGFGGHASVEEDVGTTASIYTRDYLQELKAEQRGRPKTEVGLQQAKTSTMPASSTASTPPQQEDFISLRPEILAGDDALAYEVKQGEFDSDDALEKSLLDDTQDDSDWQDQLAQRAQWGAAPIGTQVKPTPRPTSNNMNTSLSQFQEHVSKTLETLQVQKSNIQDQIRRRQDQLVDAESSMKKHKADVVSVGTALEFYQHWRIRLCEFISTIRTIQTSLQSVRPVSQSWHADVANLETWEKTWQDDVAHSLQQFDSLDQVLGRSIDLSQMNDSTTTDEFGRTVQSRDALLREKRTSRRERIQSQYQKRHMPKADTLIRGDLINLEDSPTVLRGDESDALWSDDEEETLRTRHSALKEAIMVACDSADHPECTVLQNLFDLFKEWYDAHPVEYNQCYAALSLADLASVLISAEVLLLNDPWDDSSGYNEMKWISVVHAALKEKYMDSAAVDRLVEKTAIPLLTDLFECKGVNLVSRRQVRSVGMFVKHLLRMVPKDKSTPPFKSANQLLDLVSQFTVDSLDSIAVPMTSKPTEVSGRAIQQMSPMEQAEYDATWGQMRRLRKIVTNLVDLWGPFMKSNMMFATAVLDFVSNRFLFTLSSMGNVTGDGLRQSKLDDFSAIYISIKDHTEWLEDPALMLPAAPVTGAALAYRVAEQKETA